MNRLFTNDPLWQRLAGFRLDESTASLTFTRRLARENDWSIAFAAKVLIERWRREYNTIRPHSSLGYRPPAPKAIHPLSSLPATPIGKKEDGPKVGQTIH